MHLAGYRTAHVKTGNEQEARPSLSTDPVPCSCEDDRDTVEVEGDVTRAQIGCCHSDRRCTGDRRVFAVPKALCRGDNQEELLQFEGRVPKTGSRHPRKESLQSAGGGRAIGTTTTVRSPGRRRSSARG